MPRRCKVSDADLLPAVGNGSKLGWRQHGLLSNRTTVGMTPSEFHVWLGLMLTASSYLEWGTGGSTIVASWRANQDGMPPLRIHAIESSSVWRDAMLRQYPDVEHAFAARRLTLHSDFFSGQVALFGYPADWRARNRTERTREARAMVEDASCCFDLILVDGRFRNACLLHALRLAHPHTTVLLHDFAVGSAHGRHYHRPIVQRHYGVMQMVDSLAVLRPNHASMKLARSGADPAFEAHYRQILDDPR